MIYKSLSELRKTGSRTATLKFLSPESTAKMELNQNRLHYFNVGGTFVAFNRHTLMIATNTGRGLFKGNAKFLSNETLKTSHRMEVQIGGYN